MAKTSHKKDYFTKHLFGAGVECPTKLYYYAESYPENQQAIPFIENAVFNKRLLKALARSVFADGIFIREDTLIKAASQTEHHLQKQNVVLFDAIFVHQKMMARLPIIQKEGNRLTAFHVQTKAFDSRKHQLSDAHGKIYSKWRSYLLDFAYQLYLLKKAQPDLQLQAFLMMPEKSGQSHTVNLPFVLKPLERRDTPVAVSPANQELLAKLEVTELVAEILEDPAFAREYLPRGSFEDTISYLSDLYLSQTKAVTNLGLKCKNCEFRIEKERVEQGVTSGFNECWRPKMETDNPSEAHVFDLIGAGTHYRLTNGIYDQREISPDADFDPGTIVSGSGRISQEMRQALQIHKAQGRAVPEEIFRPAIAQELSRWQYPLHFLDFEAGNYAVPIRKNQSPYHLVLFQFSCHSLQEDGSWTHHQWIDDLRSGYPNYEMVRQLKGVPDIEEGTIVQYSDFERNALKGIRRELVNEHEIISDANLLINWIEKIIHRHDSSHHDPPYMADLSRLVKYFYYNSEMEDSLSIKDVLKSVMGQSDFLREKYSQPYRSHNFDNMIWWQSNEKGGVRNPYNLLKETGDSPIRRGTEAMVAYGKMISQDLDEDRLNAYRRALLKYCELDTLAMMMIYEHWQHNFIAEV